MFTERSLNTQEFDGDGPTEVTLKYARLAHELMCVSVAQKFNVILVDKPLSPMVRPLVLPVLCNDFAHRPLGHTSIDKLYKLLCFQDRTSSITFLIHVGWAPHSWV